MDAYQAQPHVAILAFISAIVDTEYTDRHTQSRSRWGKYKLPVFIAEKKKKKKS